jgi:predicted O-linked N-acetylglucosamine transferase (SPINDLY family)
VAINQLLVDLFVESHTTPPAEVVLDFDATDDPVHGTQEGRFFHGYYGHYCYLPLYDPERSRTGAGDRLPCAYLRPSNIDESLHARAILWLIARRLRQAWPDVRIVFRGDGGSCRHRLMRSCDRRGIKHVIGLPKNKVLNRLSAEAAGHAEPLTRAAPPNTNDRNPDRPIRVGLISPDFRFHPVGRLIAPLIVHHDKAEVQIVLFSGVVRPDALSRQMYAAAEEVIDVRGASDELLAGAVRAARIDVLIDLQVHMSGTRLRTFAMRPAPVQITYLGYCSTTGMSAMDYVLTDRVLDPWEGPDPEGGAPSPIHSEKLLHVDGCYWCYSEPPDLPEPNPLPATAANGGAVTFGSLNSFTKLNDGVLNVWSELLRGIPNSRLFLVVPGGAHRQREVANMFVHRGVSADRLRMTDIVSAREYFLLYQNVDIALDPFPYAGGTTTMDALFMGVPIVTLAGRWATARAGVTLLTNAGLPQWIAHSTQQYIALATGLASDLPKLAEWRRTLRPHMRQSVLMDGPNFAADMERAFRRAWRHWCATAPK